MGTSQDNRGTKYPKHGSVVFLGRAQHACLEQQEPKPILPPKQDPAPLVLDRTEPVSGTAHPQWVAATMTCSKHLEESSTESLPGSPYWTESINPSNMPDGYTTDYKNNELKQTLRTWLAPRGISGHFSRTVCTLQQKVEQKRAKMAQDAKARQFYMM